jgi:hypothetical protein
MTGQVGNEKCGCAMTALLLMKNIPLPKNDDIFGTDTFDLVTNNFGKEAMLNVWKGFDLFPVELTYSKEYAWGSNLRTAAQEAGLLKVKK